MVVLKMPEMQHVKEMLEIREKKEPDEPAKVVKRELSRALDEHRTKKFGKDQAHMFNGRLAPWFSKEGDVIWSRVRIVTAKVVLSKAFDYFMTFVVIVNLVLIVYEVDQEAKCYPHYRDNLHDCRTSVHSDQMGQMKFVHIANLVMLSLYTAESVCRMYIQRCPYFRSYENLIDFFVCVTGWLSAGLDSMFNLQWLRILRVCRLLRALRLLTDVPELYMLFAGLMGSLRAMLCGSLMLLAMLVVCSILIVQYVHPVAASLDFAFCDRCRRGYGSVFDATLTLFQTIIAGDSWGAINVPVMEESPLVGLLLPVTMLLIGVGAMNLILAVIVDVALVSRESNTAHLLEERRHQRSKGRHRLFKMFESLDTDQNGTLSRSEMKDAFTSNQSFQTLLEMTDIDNQEIDSIFDWIDLNGDDNISYLEFCDVLEDIQVADVRKTIVLNKLMTNKIARVMTKSWEKQDKINEEQAQLLSRIDIKLDILLEKGGRRAGSGDTQADSNAWSSSASSAPLADVEAKRCVPLPGDLGFEAGDISPLVNCNVCWDTSSTRNLEMATTPQEGGQLGNSLPGVREAFLSQLSKDLRLLKQAKLNTQLSLLQELEQELRDDAAMISRNLAAFDFTASAQFPPSLTASEDIIARRQNQVNQTLPLQAIDAKHEEAMFPVLPQPLLSGRSSLDGRPRTPRPGRSQPQRSPELQNPSQDRIESRADVLEFTL